MRLLLKILMTINSTSWVLILYIIKKQYTIWTIPIWACAILYSIIPILLSLLSLLLFKFLGDDKLLNCKEFSLADNEFLPVYLGYFFVSISVNDSTTMIFVYILIFIFTFISQTQYFNPIFLLFGYHYYHILTNEGTRVFVIARGKVIRNKNNIKFEKLKRINDTTYIERG